jgi:hypothetical protein
MHLSSSPYVPHAPPISVFLTWSPEWYLVRSTEHKALCYVVFSIPLLTHPSWAQISSSALYSRKPSAYIPTSIWVTNFHNHTRVTFRISVYVNNKCVTVHTVSTRWQSCTAVRRRQRFEASVFILVFLGW